MSCPCHSSCFSGASAAGLGHRPLAETIADTLAWWNEQAEDRRAEPRAGLAADKEQSVLAAWDARDEREPAAA